MIPNNINNKISVAFSDFCSAGSSFQTVTTASQNSYQISPSDFYHAIFQFFDTKVVVSPLPILNFLRLRRLTLAYDEIQVCAPYCRQQTTV